MYKDDEGLWCDHAAASGYLGVTGGPRTFRAVLHIGGAAAKFVGSAKTAREAAMKYAAARAAAGLPSPDRPPPSKPQAAKRGHGRPRSVVFSAPPSEYELERDHARARNRAKLKELGLQ